MQIDVRTLRDTPLKLYRARQQHSFQDSESKYLEVLFELQMTYIKLASVNMKY